MESPPLPTRTPSAYERRALRELHAWKVPARGWFGKAVDTWDRVLHEATEHLRKIPGVDYTIDNIVAGLLRLTNEIAQDSVWVDGIYDEYRKRGHDVMSGDDIFALDLGAVDARLKGLDAKYRGVAAVEGAWTGYAGMAGIIPDVVSLVALNLRAAGEYATYCGVDVRDPAERLFALQLLDTVAQPSDAHKEVALKPVYKVSGRLARDQALRTLEQTALTRALRNAAKELGLSLTRTKLAQVVPVTGAVVGSGFNAYYTSKVCDQAYHLYRERFLLRKYGPDVLRRHAD